MACHSAPALMHGTAERPWDADGATSMEPQLPQLSRGRVSYTTPPPSVLDRRCGCARCTAHLACPALQVTRRRDSWPQMSPRPEGTPPLQSRMRAQPRLIAIAPAVVCVMFGSYATAPRVDVRQLAAGPACAAAAPAAHASTWQVVKWPQCSRPCNVLISAHQVLIRCSSDAHLGASAVLRVIAGCARAQEIDVSMLAREVDATREKSAARARSCFSMHDETTALPVCCQPVASDWTFLPVSREEPVQRSMCGCRLDVALTVISQCWLTSYPQ